MLSTPDPQWYLDNVLADAVPGGPAPALLPVAQWRRHWNEQLRLLDPRLSDAAVGFAVTRATVRERGVPDAEFRRLVRAGTWSIPARGAVSLLPDADAASGPDARRRRHALHSAALALVRPGQVVGARSAAIVHGLPTVWVPRVPELNAAIELSGGRHGDALVRNGALTADEVAAWFGTPVTDVARTLVDLARHDARDAIMAADAALREHLVTASAIDTALARARGWPGVQRAREVLPLARAEAESPLESLVRLALHDSGFPPAALQLEVGGYRADLGWEHAKLLLEADGRGKNTASERWREKRRDLTLNRLGYRVERVTWVDVVDDWPRTARYLYGVLTSRLL